jgi:ribosomal protein L11 methyltransferase
MAWQQLTFTLDAAGLDRAEALLSLAGAEGISLADGGDHELLEPEPGTTPVWPTVRVRALFPQQRDLSSLIDMLGNTLRISALPSVEPLSDGQWRGALRSKPAPREIGERLSVCDARGTSKPARGRALVRLNRGLGFGTGEHPSTALCLEWLERHVRNGARVVDYGCGSGILALAAIALGAARAWAVDIEPQALQAAEDNARLNDITRKELWIGAPDQLANVTVDVVVANILARPLIDLAPRFAGLLPRGGQLVVSGLLETQCNEVERGLAPQFDGFRRAGKDGWARLAAERL